MSERKHATDLFVTRSADGKWYHSDGWKDTQPEAERLRAAEAGRIMQAEGALGGELVAFSPALFDYEEAAKSAGSVLLWNDDGSGDETAEHEALEGATIFEANHEAAPATGVVLVGSLVPDDERATAYPDMDAAKRAASRFFLEFQRATGKGKP